jgi:hypothetical protein
VLGGHQAGYPKTRLHCLYLARQFPSVLAVAGREARIRISMASASRGPISYRDLNENFEPPTTSYVGLTVGVASPTSQTPTMERGVEREFGFEPSRTPFPSTIGGMSAGSPMLSTPTEYRERAKLCLGLAAETHEPRLKESLTDLAQRWTALAADLEATRELLAKWSPEAIRSRQVPDKRKPC